MLQSGNCRENMQQRTAHAALQQSKVQARAAITGAVQQQETLRGLAKQLIRAKADHEELLVDGKQVVDLTGRFRCTA